MWFVFVLRSRRDEDLYIGSTNDIQRRLAEHNSGMVESTRPRLPFDLEAYVAVRDKARAVELEQYFKTGSGKVVLMKRIL
jgi:putative endonuclease